MRRINIIGFENSKGLSKDIDLLKQILSCFDVEIHFIEITEKIRSSYAKKMFEFSRALVFDKLVFNKKQEINIFLERVVPDLLAYSQVNLLIPNPEWFHPAWRFFASNIDLVLCKTEHAIAIYDRLGFKTRYLGFTSVDRRLEEISTKEGRVLHIAGGSHFKGTARLVQCWEKHPEWPPLTVITHRVMAGYESPAANVSIFSGFLQDEALIQQQNQVLFHAYPSQAEGFGHCINEAMSCGAIVLTNDAPPMNELVDAKTGFLSQGYIQGSNCLSDLVEFDEGSFAEQMTLALQESTQAQQTRSQKAREAYQKRDLAFRENLQAIISEFLTA